MRHSEYVDYFKGLAASHYRIRHDAIDHLLPNGRRVSFCRMNGEQEMQQASGGQLDYPCMVLPKCRGRLRNDGSLVRDLVTGFFEIRMYVEDALNFGAIEDARDQCKEIGMDIIAKMVQQAEDEGACGPIEEFDPSTVQYDFTGPVNNNEYGCLFFFEFVDTAFNPVTADLTGKFL